MVKNESQRVHVLTGVCFVLAIIAAVVWYSNRPGVRPPPNGPGYYTGPMKSKGDPNVYGTDDGVRVPPPRGAVTTGAKSEPGKGLMREDGQP